jgi:hypothetical protein
MGGACARPRYRRRDAEARKLHRALGGDGDALDGDIPDKPKGMPWRTYERKVAAWMAAAERANEAWLLSAAPLFWRLGIA